MDGGRNDHCIVGKGVSRVKRNFGFLFVALFGGGVGLGLVVIVCMIPVMVFFLLPFFFSFLLRAGRSFMGWRLACGIPAGACLVFVGQKSDCRG